MHTIRTLDLTNYVNTKLYWLLIFVQICITMLLQLHWKGCSRHLLHQYLKNPTHPITTSTYAFDLSMSLCYKVGFSTMCKFTSNTKYAMSSSCKMYIYKFQVYICKKNCKLHSKAFFLVPDGNCGWSCVWSHVTILYSQFKIDNFPCQRIVMIFLFVR